MTPRLKRVRWAVRGVLVLGVAASTVANVLHANPNPISQCIAAWPPLALLITIEVISRVPVHTRWLAVARLVAAATIAGIAAWVSYWHMVGVASRYGETDASPYLLPLSVDGLVVVASICLVELSGRIRSVEDQQDAPRLPAAVAVDSAEDIDAEMSVPAMSPWMYATPVGPEPAPLVLSVAAVEPVSAPPAVDNVSDKLSDSKPAPRRRPPSYRDRVVAAHERWPDESDEQLAVRLKVSAKTVERYRPPKVSDSVSDTEQQINGRVPELVGAGHDEMES